jgi:tetratricopeptide (TPR) repeat protein
LGLGYIAEIKGLPGFDPQEELELSINVGIRFNVRFRSLLKIIPSLFPRQEISGSLYQDGEDLVLVGSFTSKKKKFTCRVFSSDIKDEGGLSDDQKLIALARLLACKLLVKQFDFGSQNWKAVQAYLCALLDFREALLSKEKRAIKLEEALKKIRCSIREDDEFPQCLFYQGLIYSELKNSKAAESSFRKAIEFKDDYAACFYALSRIYCWRGQYDEAASLCSYAISCDKKSPNYLNFAGYINYYLFNENTFNYSNRKMGSRFISDTTIGYFRKAANLSWKQYCVSIRKGQNEFDLENKKRSALLSLRNFAVMKGINLDLEADSLFNQAIFLAARDNDTCFEKGRYKIQKTKLKHRSYKKKNDDINNQGFGLPGKKDIESAYECFRYVYEDDPELKNYDFYLNYIMAIVLRWNRLEEEDELEEKEKLEWELENVSSKFIRVIRTGFADYNVYKKAKFNYDIFKDIAAELKFIKNLRKFVGRIPKVRSLAFALLVERIAVGNSDMAFEEKKEALLKLLSCPPI